MAITQGVSRKKDFSDLDLDFLAHPTTGDIVRKTGEDAIKRSVRNLILTNYYDRPFRSQIGSNVQKILFDNISPLTQNFLKDAIHEVITLYEPRVKILEINVGVSADNNGFDVTLSYQIVNKVEPTVINLFLERIR
jgi:phage baseplate assembly protein W